MKKFSYTTADEFYQSCEECFKLYAQELCEKFPEAKISHPCIRTKDDTAFNTILSFLKQIGEVERNYKDDDPKHLHPIYFVKLNKPLTDDDRQAHYIAVTPPKPEYNFTDVQLLVAADDQMAPNEHPMYPSAQNPQVFLKCQKNSAERILALAA